MTLLSRPLWLLALAVPAVSGFLAIPARPVRTSRLMSSGEGESAPSEQPKSFSWTPPPQDVELDHAGMADTAIPKSSPTLTLDSEVFVLDSDTNSEPSAAELSNENMLRVILGHATDEEVNTLVWKCLGYRRAEGAEEWRADDCFPKWRERFPSPPDLVGVTRQYSKDIDGPVLKANQALVRTVPMEHKQSIKTHLRPIGFNGFKVAELTPNKTRRAQCANWMIYYRENLWGVPLEELKRRKELERNVEAENLNLRMEGKAIKQAIAGVSPKDSTNI